MAEKFPNFHRLVPILYVRDLELEVDFYKGFGFEISYQGDEFPGFVGLRKDAIEFGLKERSDFDPVKARESFVWQMETDSFSKVIAICDENAFAFAKPTQYWEEMDAWEMSVQTPNGHTLQLEKIGKD